MPVRVAVLDLLCEREVYGPDGNAAMLRPFGEVDAIALNPQCQREDANGVWGGVPFHRMDIPYDIEGWLEENEVAALIISGSRSNLSMPEPWMAGTLNFVRRVVDHGVPTLGICFGHQMLALAYGGRLERVEEGYHDISTLELNEVGDDDSLFEGCGRPPMVVYTHRDQVVELPDRASLLGSAEHAPIAAFRIHDQKGEAMRAWGIQFHPELTPAICAYAAETGDMPFADDDERITNLAGERVLENFAKETLSG